MMDQKIFCGSDVVLLLNILCR